jgi:succinoglycan biosynthesis transport protein ExoP
MSRTYQALRRAQAEQHGSAPPVGGSAPSLGGSAPSVGNGGTHTVIAPHPADEPERYESAVATESAVVAEAPPAETIGGRSTPGEQMEFEKIRLWLTNASRRGEPVRALAVVGSRSGSGTTTAASLLALALAEGKRKQVLLVDLNFRTPALGPRFRVNGSQGLSDMVLRGARLEDCIHEDVRPGLSILSTGRVPPAPGDLFDGNTLDGVLGRLKERFDHVVLDCPAVLDFPDTRGIAPKVDAVILVVSADRTSVSDAQKARRELERAGAKVVGALFNRAKNHVPRLLSPLLA